MARRRRGGGMKFDVTTVALLAGVGYLVYTTFFAPETTAFEPGVSTGGQQILPQPAGTVWYSDPFQQSMDGMTGDQSFFIGSLPPGSAPPWRMASGTEIAAMNLGLAAGTIVAAGGGLIVHV